MTIYTLIQESVSFGTDPATVTCAVETPSGQIDVFQYGVDPQIARTGVGLYQIQIPQTVNETAAAPYTFYWQPGGITQLFPPTGTTISPPPGPAPPPPILPVPTITNSAQPGLLLPGAIVLGSMNALLTLPIAPPPIVPSSTFTDSAQPGLFSPGRAFPGSR